MVSVTIIQNAWTVRSLVFFFQAEDGIRDSSVTGVQTCALPIYLRRPLRRRYLGADRRLRPLQARLAPDLPHLARRHPLARHLPPCLLPARPGGLSEELLRLDDGADGSQGIDSVRHRSARTDADRHRRQ